MLPIDPDIPAAAASLHPASSSPTWIRSVSLLICLYFAHTFRTGVNEDRTLCKRPMKLGDLLTSSGLVCTAMPDNPVGTSAWKRDVLALAVLVPDLVLKLSYGRKLWPGCNFHQFCRKTDFCRPSLKVLKISTEPYGGSDSKRCNRWVIQNRPQKCWELGWQTHTK